MYGPLVNKCHTSNFAPKTSDISYSTLSYYRSGRILSVTKIESNSLTCWKCLSRPVAKDLVKLKLVR